MKEKIDIKEVVLTQDAYLKIVSTIEQYEKLLLEKENLISDIEKSKCVYKTKKIFYDYSPIDDSIHASHDINYETLSEDETVKKITELEKNILDSKVELYKIVENRNELKRKLDNNFMKTLMLVTISLIVGIFLGVTGF